MVSLHESRLVCNLIINIIKHNIVLQIYNSHIKSGRKLLSKSRAKQETFKFACERQSRVGGLQVESSTPKWTGDKLLW